MKWDEKETALIYYSESLCMPFYTGNSNARIDSEFQGVNKVWNQIIHFYTKTSLVDVVRS